MLSTCNTSSLDTEAACFFVIPSPVALRNLKKKLLEKSRKPVSKPGAARWPVGHPPKNPRCGAVVCGHPRSTGTVTGTAPGDLTGGNVRTSLWFEIRTSFWFLGNKNQFSGSVFTVVREHIMNTGSGRPGTLDIRISCCLLPHTLF